MASVGPMLATAVGRVHADLDGLEARLAALEDPWLTSGDARWWRRRGSSCAPGASVTR